MLRALLLSSLVSGLLFGLLAAAPASAHAQQRRIAVQGAVGSGLSFGDGGDRTVTQRSPLFLDIGVLTWTSLDESWWVGGSLRLELDGRTSAGGTVRLGVTTGEGEVRLRPYAGAATVLAPFSLLGVEAGADAIFQLMAAVRCVFRAAFNAYVLGSDLPNGSTLLMVNLSLGVETEVGL